MKNRLLTGTALLIATTTLTAQWEAVSPTTPPSALASAAMATTPSGDVLMFGGAGSFSPTNQTRLYNGTAWTVVPVGSSPSARSGMQMVYDPNTGFYRMYGGINQGFIGSTIYDQTWEFDGSTWTQDVIIGATPGGLFNYSMCQDTVHNVTVLYGGLADDFFPIDSNATWEFDGASWTQTAITGTNPGPLENANMCYDAALGKCVLFGGIDVQTGGVDTTWTYDVATHTWAAVPVVGPKPAARTGASMAYDSVRGVCVLTGGMDPNTAALMTDTWEFDGTSWTQIPTAQNAPALLAPMAFMPGRRHMVRFGGVTNPFSGSIGATTSEYGARSSTFGTGCAGSNGTPALSANDAPRLGSNYTLTLTGLNLAANLGVLVLSTASIPAVPLDFLGMTNCTAYVSPDVLLTAVGTAGSVSWTLAIPNSLGLTGATVFGQGLSLDPVNPAWLVSSNAHRGLVGR